MSDILSQSEIDELLSALSSGEFKPEQINENKDKQQIKKYDFRSPKKFSKEHLITLEMIHENYARIISSFLIAQIRTNAQIKVAIVEQITYEEFIKSISSPTILVLYKMPPLSGTLMLEINPQLVFQIVDIMFGGPGTATYKTREFTEIEKNVIKTIAVKLIDNLKYAWEDILEVDPQLMEMETNPALNQTMSPNEPVALITLSVKINEIQSYINLCIPYISVEKVLNRLVIKYWSAETDEKDKKIVEEKIVKRLQGVPLNMTVKLGSIEIPVRSFLDLQEGDVIMLSNSVERPLDMYVEDRLHYRVQPGTFNNKKAVRIVEIIDKDVEEYEQ